MSTKEFEHAYYIGNYLSGILYGIELVMYGLSMRLLLGTKRHRRFTGSRTFLALFSTLLFILVTIDISTNAVWGEQMWITYRDAPGGVPGYIATQVSVWFETLSSTSVVAMIFMGDALLIYRLYVIYECNRWLVVLPCLTWCTALGLALIQLVIAGKPGGDFFNGKTIDFGTPYYAMTIGMNIVITTLICARLFYYSHRMKQILGAEATKTYTGVAAILIESAAPYSLVGIMFLIPYARKSGTAIAFGQVWAKMTCLSPQLIILRVISGSAWGKDTFNRSRSHGGGGGGGRGSPGGGGGQHGLKSGDDADIMTTGIEFTPITEGGAASDISGGGVYGGQYGYDQEKTHGINSNDTTGEVQVHVPLAAKSGSTLVYSSTGEKTSRDSHGA